MICVHFCVHHQGVYTMLTDTKLRKSLGKRREKVEVISDSNGLNVRLSITGSITFFYRYRWQGKPVQLSIGEYPTISLSQARDRRQQFRAWLSEGYDPRQKVLVEKAERIEALTVDEAYEYWVKHYCIPEGLIKIELMARVSGSTSAPVSERLSSTRQ